MRCVVLLVLCTACCSAFATTARVAPVISTAVPLSARRPALQNPSAPAVRRQRLGASAGGARGVAMSLRGGTVAALVLAPHWTSLLPPLATIVVSLAAKQVVLALLAGLWAGAWLLHGNPLVAFLRSVDTYALEAMADPEHAGILIFTLLLGGAIGVIQKTGGSLGLARAFGPLARTRKRAAATTFGLSSLIFFDDYSSVLIVGNSLRKPIAAAGLSLQKFALIVHAMATCGEDDLDPTNTHTSPPPPPPRFLLSSRAAGPWSVIYNQSPPPPPPRFLLSSRALICHSPTPPSSRVALARLLLDGAAARLRGGRRGRRRAEWADRRIFDDACDDTVPPAPNALYRTHRVLYCIGQGHRRSRRRGGSLRCRYVCKCL
ncbi:hypothetical protein T492DRAFT_135529 [Pavlovales sp. CCMP2436]|nr:hypothetical protein T492DRAFT_135529 [Pavlovales sp. CCMP2436]